MHRARRRGPVLTEPLPQAWVPRVVNVALAAFFLLFLVPLVYFLPGLTTVAQVLLVLLAVPFLLLTVLCLCSALRPGSLGRFATKAKARRSSRKQVASEAGGGEGDVGAAGS